MPDIFLRQGEANPNDIKLQDPTVSGGAVVLLTGTSTGHSTAAATLTYVPPIQLTGTSTGQSTAAGTIRYRARLTGSSTGHSTAAGTIRYRVRLTGTSTGHSTAAGAIRARVRFTGTSAGASTASGTIRARVRFSALSAGHSGASAALTYVAPINLSGTSTAHSTAAGTLTYVPGTINLGNGLSTGQSSAAATIRARVRFTGASSGQSSATGVITYVPGITYIDLGHGQSDGRSTTSAVMIYQAPVIGGGPWESDGEAWAAYQAQSKARAAARAEKSRDPVAGWQKPIFTNIRLEGAAPSRGKSTAGATMRVRVRFRGSSTGKGGAWCNPMALTVRTSREKLEMDLLELLLLDEVA